MKFLSMFFKISKNGFISHLTYSQSGSINLMNYRGKLCQAWNGIGAKNGDLQFLLQINPRNFVIIIFYMEEKDKLEKKRGSNATAKPKRPYKEKVFYGCFCSKMYYSFPALFLHCQNSHQINITIRNLKEVKAEWSGNVKVRHLQYLEGYQHHQENQGQMGIKQNPRQNRESVERSQNERNEKKKNTTMMTTCEDNIQKIFEKYLQMMESHIQSVLSHEERSDLLKDLCKFMNRNHSEVETLRYTNYCMEKTCNNVVLFYNNYHVFRANKAQTLTEDELKQLNFLGKWLHFNNYSSNYALLAHQYDERYHN